MQEAACTPRGSKGSGVTEPPPPRAGPHLDHLHSRSGTSGPHDGHPHRPSQPTHRPAAPSHGPGPRLTLLGATAARGDELIKGRSLSPPPESGRLRATQRPLPSPPAAPPPPSRVGGDRSGGHALSRPLLHPRGAGPPPRSSGSGSARAGVRFPRFCSVIRNLMTSVALLVKKVVGDIKTFVFQTASPTPWGCDVWVHFHWKHVTSRLFIPTALWSRACL